MPKIVDHEVRRGEILDRCFALFAREGYGAVTLRGIASAAGLSTGALYHYFPDRETLLRSLLHHLSRQDVASAVRQLPPGASPQQKLATLVEFVSSQEERLRQVLLVALDHHRQHAEDRAVLSEVIATYRAAIAEQLPGAEPGTDGVVFSLLVGFLIQRSLAPEQADPAAHLRALARLLG